MDRNTAKKLTNALRSLELDDEDEQAVYSLIRRLRREAKPSAMVGVSTEEEGMGGNARLTLGEDKTAVELPVPDYLQDDPENEEVYEAMTIYLSLNRIEEGEGAGRWTAVDTVKDPDSRASSPRKLLLEQHTETGEYRYRDLPEVER